MGGFLNAGKRKIKFTCTSSGEVVELGNEIARNSTELKYERKSHSRNQVAMTLLDSPLTTSLGSPFQRINSRDTLEEYLSSSETLFLDNHGLPRQSLSPCHAETTENSASAGPASQ